MIHSLVLALCMAMVSGAPGFQYIPKDPEPCCFPEEWEADFSENSVLQQKVSRAHPMMFVQEGHIWYDSPNNRVAQQVYQMLRQPKIVQEIIILVDYNKQMKYIILPEKEKCFEQATQAKKLPRCLNETDYTFLKSLTIGQELKVNLWEMRIVNKQMQLTDDLLVTENCVPVGDSFYGEVNTERAGIETMGAIVISNVTLGIHDTKIFDIPSYCKSDMLQTDEDMTFAFLRAF
ncbi:unnamed protein product [Owenia fusiformis]|uniref:Uncharacterized protein n=1 Tax=Owenia fusiformis TaxID=6347 RepID=A0A8J1XXE2_OWEFU|nr:unnamed protein product [Owenia fusiformis]